MYYNLHITTDSQLPNYYRAFYYETGKENAATAIGRGRRKGLRTNGTRC